MSRRLPDGVRPGGRFAEWVPGRPDYVVADVDGTLIARGRTATDVVAEAVRAAHAAGLRVGFATGRMPFGVRALQEQLAPEGPHIVHNGAELLAEGRSIRTWSLSRAQAGALVDACRGSGVYAELYVPGGFFVTDRRKAAVVHWDAISGTPDGLAHELDLDAAEVIKGTIVAWTPEELPGVLALIEGAGLVGEAATTPILPGASFVNVTRPGVGKGEALTRAAEYLGIGLEAVVAVGDGVNDLSMLAVAGTAVAMGQAPPEVHRAAHLVVPEVDADGVAHALRVAAQRRSAWSAG